MIKITKFIGYVFIGSWALLGAFFYVKAAIEFML